MATKTRDRLVETAVRRFYRDGFRNVGLDQILADVGISKTAFYKHFESKEDLMLAALEQQQQWFEQILRTMIRERGGPTAHGQLLAVFDVTEMVIESDEFHGCIFVNAAIEFPLQHEPAHRAAAQNKLAFEDIVTELAAAAGADDPRALAKALCLVIEGTYVTRQVTGNKRIIDITRRIADLVIASHCGTADPAGLKSAS